MSQTQTLTQTAYWWVQQNLKLKVSLATTSYISKVHSNKELKSYEFSVDQQISLPILAGFSEAPSFFYALPPALLSAAHLVRCYLLCHKENLTFLDTWRVALLHSNLCKGTRVWSFALGDTSSYFGKSAMGFKLNTHLVTQTYLVTDAFFQIHS